MLRLCAVLFGGLIGLERESHKRPAGFRNTHSCMCGISTHNDNLPVWFWSLQVNKVTIQVELQLKLLADGFLEQVILREGASVKGLTTAASLWVVAGIGLAVGTDFTSRVR